jgi:hypothetical protein
VSEVFIIVTNAPLELVATPVPAGLIDSFMHNAMCCCRHAALPSF